MACSCADAPPPAHGGSLRSIGTTPSRQLTDTSQESSEKVSASLASLRSHTLAACFAKKTRNQARRKSITKYQEGVTSRETAARLFWPAQRQDWIEKEDGTIVNSADGVKRAIPAYMLCLDLIFAAAFNSISQILVEGLDRIHYFFALFLPIMWLWQHFNCAPFAQNPTLSLPRVQRTAPSGPWAGP